MEFEMRSCGGCRTCEIACSFKHTGEFIPSKSSIKILDKEDGEGLIVYLVDKTDEDNIACDGCKDLDIPMCVEVCEKEDDLKNILKEFL